MERIPNRSEETSSDLAVLAARIQRRLAGRIGLLVEVGQIDGAILLAPLTRLKARQNPTRQPS
jgi:hypothetical protein